MRTTLYALDANAFEQTYCSFPNCIPQTQWQTMLARGNDVVEVADLLEEMDLSDVVIEGDRVILPRNLAPLILELCLADCVTSKYQILYKDFFLAISGRIHRRSMP